MNEFKVDSRNQFTLEMDLTNRCPPPPTQPQVTVSFQQGVGGYFGTVDTFLTGGDPDAQHSDANRLGVSQTDVQGQPAEALLRFEGLFGSGPGQIRPGARILRAYLDLQSTDPGSGAAVHRMLVPWGDTDTWNSLVEGIQADNVKAAEAWDILTGYSGCPATSIIVRDSVQAWALGQPNYGWALMPSGHDKWEFQSAEGDWGPRLTVQYVPSLAGDANLDDRVDGADYTAWADHYGQPGGWKDGNFNGDALVDGADYTIWADNYGFATGQSSLVPEPSGLLCLGLSYVMLKARRSRGLRPSEPWTSPGPQPRRRACAGTADLPGRLSQVVAHKPCCRSGYAAGCRMRA